MSQPLTSRERIQRMFEHRDADRVPIVDLPWDSTIARWRREGLPAGADWAEYLDAGALRPDPHYH
jgi:uroporphyrinogen decarboxylase